MDGGDGSKQGEHCGGPARGVEDHAGGGGGEVGDVIWDLTGLTGRQNAGRVGRGIKGEDRGD